MAFMKPIVVLNIHNDLTIVDGFERLLQAPEFGLEYVLITDESGEIKKVPTRSMDARKRTASWHPAALRFNARIEHEIADAKKIAALEAKLAEALVIMKAAPVLEPDDWKELACVIGRDQTLDYVNALQRHSALIKEFEAKL